jgi:hypothetical protein
MKTLQDHYRNLDPNRAGYIEFAIAAYKALDEDASNGRHSQSYYQRFVKIPMVNRALEIERVTRREIILCAKSTFCLTNALTRAILSLIF